MRSVSDDSEKIGILPHGSGKCQALRQSWLSHTGLSLCCILLPKAEYLIVSTGALWKKKRVLNDNVR